jgi:hypothetical protein
MTIKRYHWLLLMLGVWLFGVWWPVWILGLIGSWLFPYFYEWPLWVLFITLVFWPLWSGYFLMAIWLLLTTIALVLLADLWRPVWFWPNY